MGVGDHGIPVREGYLSFDCFVVPCSINACFLFLPTYVEMPSCIVVLLLDLAPPILNPIVLFHMCSQSSMLVF